MSVTIHDVAARAGVSATAVSRVLHGKATTIRVSAATAERVRQAARDLGYRKNVLANQFRDRQTKMFGVMHGIDPSRPRFDAGSRYFAALMDGIVDGAFQHQYSVTLCPRLFSRNPEDAMADGRFDGLIWYSDFSSPENQQMIQRTTVPLVLIHARAQVFDNRFPTVVCDNEQGLSLAIDHLVGLGHTRIAYALNGYMAHHHEVIERIGAFQAICDRHPSVEGHEVIEYCSREELAQRIRTRSFTAVISWSDGGAADVMSVSEELGIAIPEQLSVIGFDSTSFCNELRPRLSSISQPLVDMGRAAVGLLVKSVNRELPLPHELVLPCGLDLRESTSSASTRLTP